jgi:twinkle protein
LFDLKDIKNKAKDVIYLQDIEAQMVESYKNGFKKGETTYIHSLDDHFRLLKGNVILFGGMGNYGKSKMVKQIMIMRAMHEDEKWAIFSPEENPPEYFYNDLIHCYIGKSPYKDHPNYMSEEEYHKGMDFVKEHFFYLFPENDSPTPKYINERFVEVHEKHGIDGTVIDPFNQLYNDWETSGRDDRYIAGYIREEKNFALKYNWYKITVHHTKSNLQKTDDGNYKMPSVYDLHGGAMWNNGCDEIIFIHREKKETQPGLNELIFKSAKIKKQIICGIPGEIALGFDFHTNRFLEFGMSPMDKESVKKIKDRIEENEIRELVNNEIPF